MISNNPAPGGTGQSPTGTPYLPPSWVRPLMAVYMALAGLAGYLALFSGNALAEKVGVVLGGILAVLGPLLGIASPGARKLATMALALGLTLTSTSAMASDRVIFEPVAPGIQAEPPSIGDLVDLGVGPSFDVTFGPARRSSLGLTVLGTVGLVDFAPGITLAAALGGALLAPLDDGGPAGALKAGLTVQFPAARANIRAAIGAGATYLPAENLWGAWAALVFHVF